MLTKESAGSWAFPGGHLEMGESFFTCAERETLEETALRVKGVKVVAVTNDVFDAASKHYITIFVQCIMEDTDAQPHVSCMPASSHRDARALVAPLSTSTNKYL